MKATNRLRTAGNIMTALIAVFILFAFSSCAKKLVFSTSAITPAASGDVKFQKDKNNNYRVDVSVRNLAPSGKLTPPRETYIVWVETESNGVKNIGQINTSKGMFSKSLKASLTAHIPFKPQNVFITGEDSQNVQYPGSMVILTTQ